MKVPAALTLLLSALAPYCESVQRGSSEQTQQSAEKSFLLSVWDGIEGDLTRLETLAETGAVTLRPTVMSALQLGAKPEPKVKSMNLGKLMKGAMGASMKGAMDAAMLMPALEMLKAQYDDGKDRITKLNAREQKLKKQYE